MDESKLLSILAKRQAKKEGVEYIFWLELHGLDRKVCYRRGRNSLQTLHKWLDAIGIKASEFYIILESEHSEALPKH